MTWGAYLRSFRSSWGALTGIALITAAILKFTSIVPPWPDEGGVGASAYAVVCCITGISLGFHARFRTLRMQRNVGAFTILAVVPLLLIYIYLYSSRVYLSPQLVDGQEIVRRVVIGLEVQIPSEKNVSVKDLVDIHGFDGSAWTRESLTASRLLLLSSYGTIYLFLTFGLGTLQRLSTRPR